MIYFILALLELIHRKNDHLGVEQWLHHYRIAVIIYRFSDREAVDYADDRRL